jgi:hypothetical protein
MLFDTCLQAQLAATMWTGSGYYSVLAWSTVVLESVPEEEMTALRSRNRDGSAAAAAIARKGGPLTPTPEQQRAERVSTGRAN